MRGPAGVQGVYGNRPSTGAVALDEVIPLSPHLDTAGVFARSASLWSKAAHAWYQNFTDDYSAYPREVYYSKGTSTESDPATALVESFVDRLQGFLDGNNTTVNVTERWATTTPSNVTNSLSELLSDTYAVLTSVDQFKLLGQQLFEDYGAENDGRRPFINPGPLVRWQWGQNHSSEYDAAVHNATIFNSWVRIGIGTYLDQSPANSLPVVHLRLRPHKQRVLLTRHLRLPLPARQADLPQHVPRRSRTAADRMERN